jgi:hypothetical protein
MLLQNPWLGAPTGTAPSPAQLERLSGSADRTGVVAVEVFQLGRDVLADPLAWHFQGVLFVEVLL